MGVIPVGLSLLLLQDKLDALHATSPWLPKRASLSRDVGTPRAVYRTTAGLSMFHRQNSRSSWKTGRYRTLRGGSIEGEGPEDTSSSRSNADISAPRGGGGSLRTMEGITADAEMAPGKNNSTHSAKDTRRSNSVFFSRKVTHAAAGLGLAILHSWLDDPRMFLRFMACLSTVALLAETLRFTETFHWLRPVYSHFVGGQMRPEEWQSRFVGSLYFFWGVLATAYLLASSSSNNKAAVSMGILQLGIADPSASFFGQITRHVQWSRIKNGFCGLGRNKGILGFVGGALVCLPFNYLALRNASVQKEGGQVLGDSWSVAAAALAIGVAGSLADLAVPTPSIPLARLFGNHIPPIHFDDNLVIPLFAALACLPIFAALEWNSLTLSPLIFL